MPTGLGGEQLWISPTNDNTGTSTAFDDLSGEGNDGTAVGAITVSADTGDGGTYAFNLAAGADGVTLPAGILDGLTEYSYGLWVKLAGGQASSSNILGGYNSSSTQTNPTFFVGATDYLRVLGKTDSGSTISVDIENPATSGVWKHLFFTYSAESGLKTYENGVLLNTYTVQPTTGGDGSVPFAIGKSYHNATICLTDDTRVYYRELTQVEVTHLATSRGIEGPAPVGLGGEKLWLCPTINDSANDISGSGYSGNYIGGMGTVPSAGSGGTRAYSMNGSSQYINNLGQADWDFITGTGVFSVSLWGKNNSTSASNQQTLISTDYDSTGTGFGLASVVGVGQEFFLTKDVGGVFAGRTTQSVTTGLNAWTLYTITGDGTTQRMYVDGVQVDAEAFVGPFSTNTQSKPLEIGSYNSGSLLWNGEIDDVRIFDRAITLAEINHLASARGVQGGPTTLGASLRANASYVTDTDGFDACTPNNGGAGNRTDEYSAAQGFGLIAGTYATNNFRDRSTSLATQLAGMTFQSANGATFRMDLPEGAGEYKVWFAGIDAASGQSTGWRFKDGTGGTEFATLDQQSTPTLYVDINNTQQLASAFDVAGSNYIQRTFTNDHFTIVRDTSLATGNGVISSVWVEYVGTTPPTSGFYDPFSSQAFYSRFFGTRNN